MSISKDYSQQDLGPVGTLLSIYLESCAGPNVMMQQVTQRMDDIGQDPCGAHRWAPEAAKLLTVVAPPTGSLPLPRRARGPMSVPCSWGTHSYCAKTRVVIHNYALRSFAARPLGSNSISPDQRSRTRPREGSGSGVTTCPRGGNAQHLWPRTRTPAGGSGTSTCHPDSRRWVRDLHVPIRTSVSSRLS